LHGFIDPLRHSAPLPRNSQLRLAFFFIGDSHMPKGPFIAAQFVPTEWSSAADKAAFGNTFLHFVESAWKRSLFTKGFYQRLSNCFGHIAHYVEDEIMWSVDARPRESTIPTPSYSA
jgi:hypothetical protein